MVPVALRGGGPNGAPPGTVAAFAASQGVEAEGMRVTHLTLGPDRVGRAEALPRHLFTKAWATVACWPGNQETRCKGETPPGLQQDFTNCQHFQKLTRGLGETSCFFFIMPLLSVADLKGTSLGAQTNYTKCSQQTQRVNAD